VPKITIWDMVDRRSTTTAADGWGTMALLGDSETVGD
jgi:hypothetical protein